MRTVVPSLIYSVIVPDSKQDTNKKNSDAFLKWIAGKRILTKGICQQKLEVGPICI